MSTIEERTRLLTVAEVAERLQLHPGTVYRLVESGQLPAIKLGSGRMAPIRIDPRELDEWLRGEAD